MGLEGLRYLVLRNGKLVENESPTCELESGDKVYGFFSRIGWNDSANNPINTISAPFYFVDDYSGVPKDWEYKKIGSNDSAKELGELEKVLREADVSKRIIFDQGQFYSKVNIPEMEEGDEFEHSRLCEELFGQGVIGDRNHLQQ